jgi:ABC-type sugar transport system ATPase subunit
LSENIFEIRELSKHFAGVKALDEVSFDIKRGTCHCLVGENGAGKSTLIKVLTGAHKKTSGQVLYNGEDFNPSNTREATATNINIITTAISFVELFMKLLQYVYCLSRQLLLPPFNNFRAWF